MNYEILRMWQYYLLYLPRLLYLMLAPLRTKKLGVSAFILLFTKCNIYSLWKISNYYIIPHKLLLRPWRFYHLVCAIVYFVENLSLHITYNALLGYLGLGLSAGVSGCFSPVCHSLLFSNSPYQSHIQKCLEHILQKGNRPSVHLWLDICVTGTIIEKNEYFMMTRGPYPYALMQSGHQIIRFALSMVLSWEFKHIYTSLKAWYGYIEFWVV